MDQISRSKDHQAVDPAPPTCRIASDFEHDASQPGAPDPTVIVVTERPSRGSSLLLPPLLLILLGVLFLAYRSHANDWKGLAAWFEPATPHRLIARNEPAPEPPPSEDEADETGASETGTDPAPAADQTPPAEPAPEAAPAPSTPADDAVRDDIEAEAEKTREKIAELQRLKEQEEQDLEATEKERREADRRAAKLPRFQLRGIAPEDIEKMLRQQREQMAWAERLFEKQMEEMAEMQRRFLRDGFDSPDPTWPPRRFALPMPRPEAPVLPRAGAGNDRIIRLPDGTTVRMRQFRGMNGMQGFEWGLNAGPQAAPNDPAADVPPPPRPAFRGRRID